MKVTIPKSIEVINELEQENATLKKRVEYLEHAWFVDEKIQADGSLRPSISDTVERMGKAEADLYFEHHNTAGLYSICNEALAREDKVKATLAALKNAYSDYVQLLVNEINDLVPLAFVHGWKSTRHEEEVMLLAKIKAVLDSLK